jgi:hypothetical protein
MLLASMMVGAALVALIVTMFANPVSAQATTVNGNVTVNYSTTYETETADVSKPVILQLENHLYYPGNNVDIHGNVWIDLVNQVDALNLVKVEIKDSVGNIVAREDMTVDRNNGTFSGSLRLLDNAPKGIYTAEARVELEADALGIVQTITSATLQSSIQFAVAAPVEYEVNAEAQNFTVSIASNSGINDFQFKQPEKRVSFLVEGDAGTKGVAEVTIPKALLSGEMSVFMDQNLVAEEDVIVKSETDATTTFEINYHHSIHRMEVTGTSVVPEFPLSSLALVASVVGIIVAIGRSKLSLGNVGKK